MRIRSAVLAAATFVAACGEGKNKTAVPSVTDSNTTAKPAGDTVRAPEPGSVTPAGIPPTDAASASSAAGAANATTAGKKNNAAAPGELRDSVIKPTMIVDEKTGKVTPIVKKPD